MSEERNPFPEPNSIREYVQHELMRRKEVDLLAVPTPTIMPFVRFSTTKMDMKYGGPGGYKFFHLGLHGLPDADIADDFGNVFEMSYGASDVVGYGYTSSGKRRPVLSTHSRATKSLIAPAQGKHPIPGVTGVNVEHMGTNEPIKVNVDWVCYNPVQLEFLRQHFLLAGGYVIIEFGHRISNRIQSTPFDFVDAEAAIDKLSDYLIEGRKIMSDELFEQTSGNYNMVIGQIVDTGIGYRNDGIINGTTTFYSTGEAVFGVSNYRLLGRLKTEEDIKKYTSTIAEFFEDGGSFDQLINTDENIFPHVVQMKASSEDEVLNTVGAELTEEELTKFAANDFTFIPFEVFFSDILTKLFAVVNEKNVSDDARLFTIINRGYSGGEEPSVGNHRLLSSTNPDVMVIVKESMMAGNKEGETSNRIDPSRSFSKARTHLGRKNTFVDADGTSEERGKLSNGVWLNTDYIKESFRQSNNFYQSIMTLLRGMNNSVENYWRLDLAFDEETKQYKIYDRGNVFESKTIPKGYLFNEQARGELLNIDFDASFSKEARSAILLAGRARTVSQRAAEGLEGQEARGYGQPSIYTDALNVPLLDDLLYDAEFEKRRSLAGGLSFKEASIIVGTAVATGRVLPSVAARVSTENEVGKTDRANLLSRYRDPMGAYIDRPSNLMARIAADGEARPSLMNNFVAPVPTEVSISMTMMGITGFAFFDTFYVDKLPRVYKDHGVFLIDGIKHNVSRSTGWTTTISGLYYFIRTEGTGQASGTPVGPTEEVSRDGDVQVPGGTTVQRISTGERKKRDLDRERAERAPRRGKQSRSGRSF